jgi:hypothetical protein
MQVGTAEWCEPYVGARAGTTNTVGGLVNDVIDAKNFKSGTLVCMLGNMPASSTGECKVTDATASAGTPADLASGAIASQVATDDDTVTVLDFNFTVSRTFLGITLVITESASASAAMIVLHNPTR